MARSSFVLLVVLDGWGLAPPSPGNAIALASPKNFSRFWAAYPHTQLRASGDAVGLPRGEVGNTETGHLNIGAGKIVYQDLARINMSVADGAFFQNQVLIAATGHVKKNGSKLHLMGLLGAGGVHSSIEHLFSLIRLASQENVERLFIHAFTDGRDSPPNASLSYFEELKTYLAKEKVGKLATVMGRYWALDRDLRWERTSKAYDALTKGIGEREIAVEETIRKSYEKNVTDEFILPTILEPEGLIEDNDAVVFFNFRIDRPRQLTRAFVLDDLKSANLSHDFDPYAVKYSHKHTSSANAGPVFNRGEKLKNLFFVTMTEYSRDIVNAGAKVAFPPENVKMPLGRVISGHNLRQLRAAESEKERFVTYYFNGQSERLEPGEDRIIIPSPRVATYDLAPEMAAYELTRAVYERLVKTDYSFAVVNFANADMVSHTGNLEATVKAVRVVDNCIGELARLIISYGGTMIITADHGNAEEMISSAGTLNTEHSNNPVPFVAVSKDFVGKAQMLPFGILADIAPTVLALMGLSPATSMTGRNLLASVLRARRR